MASLKVVGSGLTARKELFLSLKEADQAHKLGMAPILEEIWEDLEKKSREVLKNEGLPVCWGTHAVSTDRSWKCVPDNELASQTRDLEYVVPGPWGGENPDESAPKVAAKLLHLIRRIMPKHQSLLEVLPESEHEPFHRYTRELMDLGRLGELLVWKPEHENAAIKQYEAEDRRADGRRSGAKVQHQGRRRRLDIIERELLKLQEGGLRKKSAPQLAAHFLRNCLPKIEDEWDATASDNRSCRQKGTITKYINELRKSGRLPAPM